jgi:hypothetical protein
LHLFNETWRRAGIPSYEYLLQKYGFDAFLPRMELADLKRWTSYLTLHEEFQTGQKAYRLSNEALRARLNTLEQENTHVSNEALRLNALEQENARLSNEAPRLNAIAGKCRSEILFATPANPLHLPENATSPGQDRPIDVTRAKSSNRGLAAEHLRSQLDVQQRRKIRYCG